MTVVVWVAAGALVLALVIWAGTRMVRTSEGGGGVGNGLGTFVDVFDPARARADEDLKSKEHQREATPLPEDDDRPVSVDLTAMRVRVKRPAVSPLPED